MYRISSLKFIVFMGLALFVTLFWLGGNTSALAGEEKVVICHIPPGNPNNAHTITVGASAVAAHLAHGDTLGPCGSGGDGGGGDGPV